MPHSILCKQAVREAMGPRAEYEGWCMGVDCTFTREDAPELWDAMQETYTQGWAQAERDERFYVPDMRMRERMTFDITPDHMRLVERLYWTWDDSACEGAPAVGIKRPYGNSDVAEDIAEILGWPMPWRDRDEDMPEDVYDRAMKLHRDLATVLQIMTCTLSCRAGTYEKKTAYMATSWERVDDERDDG